MIMKPFIYQGPTPGQTMREANLTNTSRVSTHDNGGQKYAQQILKSGIPASSNGKERNPQMVAGVSASASKISIDQIVSKKQMSQIGQGLSPQEQSVGEPSPQSPSMIKA